MAELALELDTEQKTSLENSTQVKRLERKAAPEQIKAYKKLIEEIEEIAVIIFFQKCRNNFQRNKLLMKVFLWIQSRVEKLFGIHQLTATIN